MSAPSGTVTFAFTDIVGSTQRWERDRAAMEAALQRHDAIVRGAVEGHGGYVFKTLGDAFCAAFSRPVEAIAAMLDVARAMRDADFSDVEGLPVRIAIHTGVAEERDGDYFGPVVNRIARLLAIGHGGQVLVSEAAASLASPELRADTSLRDLGRHRLKDLNRPERVFQLSAADLPGDFPALRSLGEFAGNLPVQLTSLVGREADVATIAGLLRAHRFVSIVGAGGVGKTRTALQAAADALDEFEDGAWFVELAPLANGEFVASTVAADFGVTLAGSDPTTELIAALRPKRLLLVLDNCEHVAAATARLAAALLAGCPGVKMLTTSRQPLEVAGERVYRLPSLAVPSGNGAVLSAAEANRNAAVQLFVERARAADDRFALTDDNASDVADICRRLDGIPLAIELAASRTSAIGLRELSRHLDERFRLLRQQREDRLPRQQTLRALIDWSFDLLHDDEARAMSRLSIFAGGWTLAAATAVCADDETDAWTFLEILSALVAKSLVVADAEVDDRRYSMLITIRDYSAERLSHGGERESVARRHAQYYAEVASQTQTLADALEDERWLRVLAPEIDNLRAAVDWAVVRGHDARAGLKLLAHMEWPELLTTPQEAVGWYDAALASLSAAEPTVRARVLRHYVRLEWLVGRPNAAREATAMRALEAARESGERDEIALSLAGVATVYRDAGRYDEAETLFEQAYQDADTLSAAACNTVLRNWAVCSLQRGAHETARRQFADVAERERPGSTAHASALLNIGELEFAVGNVDAARAFAGRARETFAQLNTAPLGLAVCNLAAYAMAADDVEQARELLAEALQLLKRSGARWMTTAIEHHAVLAGIVGSHDRAALLLGYTIERYAGNDARQTTERHGYERLRRLLSDIYDEEELARRLKNGARLTEEQALAHAAAISSSEGSTRNG